MAAAERRSSTRRCPSSPIRRSATAAPSAATWRTPIRRPSCRPWSLALGARLRAPAVRGDRWMEAADFFAGLFTTALEPDEMLVEVGICRSPAAHRLRPFWSSPRRRGDYAIIGVAARVTPRRRRAAAARRGWSTCNAGDAPVAWPRSGAAAWPASASDAAQIDAAAAMACGD